MALFSRHRRNACSEHGTAAVPENGSKTPQQAMADATKRGNDKLREFEKTNI